MMNDLIVRMDDDYLMIFLLFLYILIFICLYIIHKNKSYYQTIWYYLMKDLSDEEIKTIIKQIDNATLNNDLKPFLEKIDKLREEIKND